MVSFTDNPSPDRVAHGLRVEGFAADRHHLLEHPPGSWWPAIRLDHEAPSSTASVGDTGASVTVPLGSGNALRLAGPRATFISESTPSTDMLIHPLLTTAAAGRNRLLGREVLHAGAVIIDGVAWALAGTNRAGKSTLAAALLKWNATVLTDDMLVLDGLTAFAGPRCADLREPDHVEDLTALAPVRDGLRWRHSLGPSAATAALGGVVFLAWHDSGPALLKVSPADRLARLALLRRWPFLPSTPGALLALAALPTFELRRSPRTAPADTADFLHRSLAAHARRSPSIPSPSCSSCT